MNDKILLFDVDNTLYSSKQRLGFVVSENIREYIMDVNRCSYEESKRLQKRYYEEYGSTLQGLIAEKSVNPLNFLKTIHKIDKSYFPKRNKRLRNMLLNIPNKKIVITNSYRDYSVQVLESLGILDLFQAIYDVVDMDYKYKSHSGSYLRVAELAKIHPCNSVMIDDLYENLKKAAEYGMDTILVRHGPCIGTPLYHIQSIYDLERLMNNL